MHRKFCILYKLFFNDYRFEKILNCQKVVCYTMTIFVRTIFMQEDNYVCNKSVKNYFIIYT